MSKLYTMKVSITKTATLTTTGNADFRSLTPFAHQQLCENSVLRQVLGPNNRKRPILDFMYGGGPYPLLMSEKANTALEKVLVECGAVVNFTIENEVGSYFAFTPNKICDPLDIDKSQLSHSQVSTRLRKAVLKSEVIIESPIFLVKGFEKQFLWVTNEIPKLAKSHGLTGVTFVNVEKDDF